MIVNVEALISSGERYISLMENIPLHYLVLALLSYYLSVMLYALRWKVILRGTGNDAELVRLFKIFMGSIFLNNVTPTSRSGGELLRIVWLSREKEVPLPISTASVVYERVLEAVPFMLLMLLGALRLLHDGVLIAVLMMVGVVLLWAKWDSLLRLFLRLMKSELDEHSISQLEELKRSWRVTLVGIGLSTAVWVLDVFRIKVVALAFGLNLPIGVVVLISVANMLLGIASITPGGIGITEGGLIGVLIHLGIPAVFAVPVTFMERFVSYVQSTVVGMIVMFSSGGAEIWRALKSRS